MFFTGFLSENSHLKWETAKKRSESIIHFQMRVHGEENIRPFALNSKGSCLIIQHDNSSRAVAAAVCHVGQRPLREARCRIIKYRINKNNFARNGERKFSVYLKTFDTIVEGKYGLLVEKHKLHNVVETERL